MTMRRMMFVVAMTAGIFWSWGLNQGGFFCRRQSAYHHQRRVCFEGLRRSGIEMRGSIILPPGVPPTTGISIDTRGSSIIFSPGVPPTAGVSTDVDEQGEEYVHSVKESIDY